MVSYVFEELRKRKAPNRYISQENDDHGMMEMKIKT
jgi:hypothetical protein